MFQMNYKMNTACWSMLLGSGNEEVNIMELLKNGKTYVPYYKKM